MTIHSFLAIRAKRITSGGLGAFKTLAGSFLVVLCLSLGATLAWASASFTYVNTYDFATGTAEGNFFAGKGCGPNCSVISTNAQVNSSDWAVGQEDIISGLASGDVVSWQAVEPDGVPVAMYSLTYSSGCFDGSDGQQFCEGGDYIDFMAAITTNICRCYHAIGNWSISVYYNGAPVSGTAVSFTVSHNPASPLGITSPTPPQNWNQVTLVDLAADQNFISTDTTCPPLTDSSGYPTSTCFSADTNTGNPITWTVTLQYATSANTTSINYSIPTFTTESGNTQEETFQNMGGQVSVTASTTASDGSTIQDCETFYIEGPPTPGGTIPGGIPNSSITSQLETSAQSYPSSKSYPSGGTSDLMAQVAVKESSYRQFQSTAVCNGHPDLWSLYFNYGVHAYWPEEPDTWTNGQCTGTEGGSYIGLMQVMTDVDQTSDPNAWNWVTNAADGVGLFSGTPPAEYSTKSNKIQTAASYEKQIMSNYPHGALPTLDGYQLENMALLLYGPGASTVLGQQYYEPTCTGTVDSKNNCSTGWQWRENSTGNPGGTAYVDLVRNESIPP